MNTFLDILNDMVQQAVDPQTAAVAIAVIGLNIHFGFTGLLNFGQAGFMLLGAYGFAISISHGLPIFVALVIGLLVSVLFALVLGIPTLKLRGDYLAIVTISAAEIVRFVGRLAQLESFTGASQGVKPQQYIPEFSKLSPFGEGSFTLLPFNYQDVAGGASWVRLLATVLAVAGIVALVRLGRSLKHAVQDPHASTKGMGGTRLLIVGLGIAVALLLLFAYPVTNPRTGFGSWWISVTVWAVVALSVWVSYLLVRSPWGRLLRGIREDEDAIRSLGKNVFALKMQSLVIGGVFGALGGVAYALAATVQPDALGRQVTFFCYTALLIGGAASIFGPVLGTMIFFAGRQLIIGLSTNYIPASVLGDDKTNAFAFVVIGVVLMLIVVFRPQGILGNKRELRFSV